MSSVSFWPRPMYATKYIMPQTYTILFLEDHKIGKDLIQSDVLLSNVAQKLRENPTLFPLALSAAYGVC